MLKHIFENKVEFYITNVCNLTCDNCNRFNNHKFAGWQRWSDYADTWRQWSEYIDIKNIVLMGGEPTLNSTLNEWVTGLTEIFGSSIQILSNGIHLNKVPGLYDSLAQTRDRGGPVPGCVQISLHNLDHFEQIRNNIKTFLSTPAHEYGQVLGIANGDQPMNSMYYSLRDINDVVVNVHLANSFSTAAVVPRPDGRFTLHNSDPVAAHKVCGFQMFRCYHFSHGKIFKCAPTELMLDFDSQFNLDITEQDRELLASYQPMTVDRWSQHHQAWLAELHEPIAQCKFCPETFEQQTIWPLVKHAKTVMA
jgi:organic radical activating enzyme